MSHIVTTFESYIKKLEYFQNNDQLKIDKTDLELIEDILFHLRKAIKGKKKNHNDWQIAYMDIIDVQYKGVPFPKHAKLTRIAYDELVSFCETHTQMRKELSHQILNYILHLKYPEYEVGPVHPKVIELLTHIFGDNFKESMCANTFVTLLDKIVKSNLLSNMELRNWALLQKRVGVEDWHECVSQALLHIPRKHFNNQDAQLTPLERERMARRSQYKKKPTRLIQSMPLLPQRRELPLFEDLPEDQLVKCKSAPLLFRKSKKQNSFLEPNQPTVSGSAAISEEESFGGLTRDLMQLSIQGEYPQETRDLSRESLIEGERESRFKRKTML